MSKRLRYAVADAGLSVPSLNSGSMGSRRGACDLGSDTRFRTAEFANAASPLAMRQTSSKDLLFPSRRNLSVGAKLA